MDIKDVSLGDILNFIKFGSMDDAPEEIRDYVLAMDKVRGMHLRYGDFGSKNVIVGHLIKFDGLSYYLANKLYNQTLEYFYCSTEISKKAWKNIYAEQLDELASFARMTAKDARDAKAVAAIVKEAGLMRGLDEEDIPELPSELFEKPFNIYAMDPEFVGQKAIDRNQLARFIDELPEATEGQKDRLKSEAAITPIILFNNEQEDIRKQ